MNGARDNCLRQRQKKKGTFIKIHELARYEVIDVTFYL